MCPVEQDPAFVPVELTDEGRLVWLEVGDCPFTHSSFEWSLASWDPDYTTRRAVETDLEAVAYAGREPDPLEPTALVFHMSRCGSSLLARALAQSRAIGVASEPPVLNSVLRYLSGDDLASPIEDPARRRILRGLVLALGRRRDPAQRAFVVKLSSWNVMWIDSLRSLFPGVPCWFLYRDPAEVMVSLVWQPPGFVLDQGSRRAQSLTGLAADAVAGLRRVAYVARCLARMLEAARSSPGVAYLAYADLVPSAVPALVGELGIEVSELDLARMQDQFRFDAKAFDRNARFVPDADRKQAGAAREIREAIRVHQLAAAVSALEASEQNLGRRLTGEPRAD